MYLRYLHIFTYCIEIFVNKILYSIQNVKEFYQKILENINYILTESILLENNDLMLTKNCNNSK